MRCLSRPVPIAYVVVSVVLSSCAAVRQAQPVGHDYAQASFGGFVLDQTSEADVEAALGPPVRKASLKGPSSDFVVLSYVYAPFGVGTPAALHPMKLANLAFFADRLLAYGAIDRIPGEISAPVDETQLAALQPGVTTRSAVIGRFGAPTAQLLHKFDAQRGASEISYTSIKDAGGTITQRTVRIVFDRTQHVATYNVLENSFPDTGGPLLNMPTLPPMPPGGLHPIPQSDRTHT